MSSLHVTPRLSATEEHAVPRTLLMQEHRTSAHSSSLLQPTLMHTHVRGAPSPPCPSRTQVGASDGHNCRLRRRRPTNVGGPVGGCSGHGDWRRRHLNDHLHHDAGNRSPMPALPLPTPTGEVSVTQLEAR
eukprot:scaffold9828_cov105-Isochrysis_galbana.AAC.3